MTVGRAQLSHPALATAGGSSLFTSINSLWTLVSDHLSGRWLTVTALANGATTTLTHNFGVPFQELRILLYTGTVPSVAKLTGMTVIANGTNPQTQIDITAPGSGGPFTFQVWILHVPSSGGGGGGGAVWNGPAGLAAQLSEENNEKVYLFPQLSAAELDIFIKVPEGYVAGNPIKMYIGEYSPSTSGTIFLKTVATLIRQGTDALTSTTNQRTSTNSALTNTVANQYRRDTYDLTDSTGKINSVAVSPGDLIKVQLTRDGSDSDTADIRMMPSATEVTFT